MMAINTDDYIIEMPPSITIPSEDALELHGIDPVIVRYEDITSDYAWWRLTWQHATDLEYYDFKDPILFRKYWFISLGLLDYPVILCGGDAGSGKSLFMAWLTWMYVQLFGKKATLDWMPRQADVFGKYNHLYDEDFQDKIIDGYARIREIEKRTGMPAPQEEVEKLVTYKAAMGLDECDSYAVKGSRTNITKLLAMIYRRRRHTYTCSTLVLPDINNFDPLIAQFATHRVDCVWEGNFPGWSSVMIEDIRKNGTHAVRSLDLNPKEWLPLWRSHSVPQLVISHNITFGKKKPKKKDGDNNE